MESGPGGGVCGPGLGTEVGAGVRCRPKPGPEGVRGRVEAQAPGGEAQALRWSPGLRPRP